jgi:uncharacterized SAM-binding protein YcdF (DUF218 family)
VYSLELLAGAASDPSVAVLILLAAGSILLFTRKAALGRLVVAAGVLLLLSFWLLPVNQWLLRPLENKFTRPANLARVDGILVLGGGLHPDILKSRHVPADEPSYDRLVAAAELAQRFPRARLIFSGGEIDGLPPSATEASVAIVLLKNLGVPPHRIELEQRAQSTWQNLALSDVIARPKPTEVWVLVTAASHMPRAVAVARKIGWKVVPWPSSYMTSSGPEAVGEPIERKLLEIRRAAHEWYGLVWYRLTGRIDSIW